MDEGASHAFRFKFCSASSDESHARQDDKHEVLGSVEDGVKMAMPPHREVFPAEVDHSKTFVTDTVTFQGAFTMLKGRVTTASVMGVGRTDLIPGKYEGGLKMWECTVDLVEMMRREMKDGQLSFRGKRVLELGCGHGLPGIFAIMKGAATVHFQDFNEEVLRSLTIPNVAANLEQAQSKSKLDSTFLSKSDHVATEIHYFAGDWGDVHELLSVVVPEEVNDSSNEDEIPVTPSPSTPQPEKSEGHSNGGVPSLLGRRKSSSSRAFERAFLDIPQTGYDIILMAETVYSLPSLPKLYNLIKLCLSRPYGVLYVAAKKHYFGVGGGTRQFKALVDEDGILGGHLVTDFTDGSSNVREVWKFFFR